MTTIRMAAALAACVTLCSAPLAAQQANMSFFVTSQGPGKGADLGGLAGADKHCQDLAASVGAGGKTWHAYLSTQGAGAVNARDRIGKGPWQNAKGVVIATSVADLHSDNNKFDQDISLSEKGEPINGYGDKPNRHDILTGSQAGRHRVSGGQGHDLQELHEQYGRLGHARPFRPQWAGHFRDREIVEFGTRIDPTRDGSAPGRLQPEGADRHRWRRAAVLLRGELDRRILTAIVRRVD